MKISKKLIVSMLALTLGTLIIVYGGMYVIMSGVYESIETQYSDIKNDSVSAIEGVQVGQAENSLKVLAGMQAEVTDSRLEIVSDIVKMSAEFAEKLYASPSSYSTSPYSPVRLSEAPETLSARYMYSFGVRETEDLKKELTLLSNIEELFAPLMRHFNDDFLDNLYVGTASGIFYQYTTNNEEPNIKYVVTLRHWYQSAAKKENLGSVMWKETEIDSYGRPCITASTAVRDADGNVVAVVAADVDSEQLMNYVIGSGLGKTGQSFVIGAHQKDGEPLPAEEINLVAYVSLNDEVKKYNELHNSLSDHFSDPKKVIENVRSCLGGGRDVFEAVFDGKEIYMTARNISSTGWILCTAINMEEVLEPAGSVEEKADSIITEASKQMAGRIKVLVTAAICVFVAIAFLVIIIVYFISRTISKPIIKLTDTVKNTGEGDFEKKSDIDTKDEIGDLARGFNKMQDDLKRYTENLQSVTAEKERISTELNVATQIQADMLPRIFPPFPQKKEIDLFASMTPAKEVGGDFYDFFLTDENHLALVIADVSGKGVPASLFMVISKTLIKNRAMQGGSPAEILADVNNQLCEGNDSDMFVTCWLGIFDLSTGIMTAASAGHEFPAICGQDRKFELLKDKHGIVLAAMPGARYRDYEIQLERGGSIFVYTDGVPEATNGDNKMFGNERLLEALNRSHEEKPETFVSEVSSAVKSFTGEAPQFDDVTMLGMTWFGKSDESDE